jgi:hypothetical protein
VRSGYWGASQFTGRAVTTGWNGGAGLALEQCWRHGELAGATLDRLYQLPDANEVAGGCWSCSGDVGMNQRSSG